MCISTVLIGQLFSEEERPKSRDRDTSKIYSPKESWFNKSSLVSKGWVFNGWIFHLVVCSERSNVKWA